MADIEIIHAGFPSPANDYMETDIDLNKLLKPRPTATFYGRVKGDCFTDAHIPNNAILIIDKSITPKNNSIIIAILEGELYLKRLVIQG
ncbi:MAG TPA: S24 family peptidase, partial [Chitinophagaceae bacterium]|nr:S24 family peptidase [Chitinophagaceae bacterium]